MADPVETFVGWTAIGFGVISVYAAIKNKGVIKDILKPALMTGTFPGKKGAPGLPAVAQTNPATGLPSIPITVSFGGDIIPPGVSAPPPYVPPVTNYGNPGVPQHGFVP